MSYFISLSEVPDPDVLRPMSDAKIFSKQFGLFSYAFGLFSEVFGQCS